MPSIKLFVFIFASFFFAISADTIVTIKQGQLNGTILKSRDDKPFYAFLGIPYTEPPIGKLRFAAPQKAPSWQGIRDATKPGPICLQAAHFSSASSQLKGQEDCLYLNVYTPEINSSELLPVMVYIHGGAFRIGSANPYGPQFFMDKALVIVTINHRHGVLGYLSSSDTVIPGNYGLKDQTAALKWVKSNIANFGGDPNMVTIFGQSSGSTSVHLHTMSPLSKGLFHRVIMHSGSALTFWSHYNARHAKRSFKDFTSRVNCIQNSTTEILSCLRELPAEELVQIENKFTTEKRIVIKFRPTIEKRKVKHAFMTDSPQKLNYQNTSIPWILGFTSAEGKLDASWVLTEATLHKNRASRKLTKIMPYFLHYKYVTMKEKTKLVTSKLKKFYFEDESLQNTNHQNISDLISDIIFGMPILDSAYSYPGPKYFFYYDYTSDSNGTHREFNFTLNYDIKGAAHGEDLIMLFPLGYSNKTYTEADKKLSRQMTTYWSNFIRSGDPNSADLTTWNELHAEIGEYLHISNDGLKMKKDLLRDRYNFWKNLLT